MDISYHPPDWGLVLESPLFWGAVMTLIGVVITQWWIARGKRGDQALTGLTASVSVLQAELERVTKKVDKLEGKVSALQDERADLEKRHRLLQEKYHAAAIVWGSFDAGYRMVKVRADAEGFDLPDFPDLPDLIREDFEHAK